GCPGRKEAVRDALTALRRKIDLVGRARVHPRRPRLVGVVERLERRADSSAGQVRSRRLRRRSGRRGSQRERTVDGIAQAPEEDEVVGALFPREDELSAALPIGGGAADLDQLRPSTLVDGEDAVEVSVCLEPGDDPPGGGIWDPVPDRRLHLAAVRRGIALLARRSYRRAVDDCRRMDDGRVGAIVVRWRERWIGSSG